jgi:predicted transcriptional regulator
MVQGKKLDEATKRRIRNLRERQTSNGRPLSFGRIAKMVRVSRKTAMRVCGERPCRQ